MEKPKFWSWATLRVDRENNQEVLQIQSSRVNIVQNIKIMENVSQSVVERVSHSKKKIKNSKQRSRIQSSVRLNISPEILSILKTILPAVRDGRSQLKKLVVKPSRIDVSSLDPALLASAMVRLEEWPEINHLLIIRLSGSLLWFYPRFTYI